MNSVLQSIRVLLDAGGARYREIEHAPTPTSRDSAAARRDDLRIGGKSLVLKVGSTFHLFVLSAALQLDSQAIKLRMGSKHLRFATLAELHSLTGLAVGAVPPFGRPILPFDLHLDPSILANREIAFNAGSLVRSINMSVDDYVRIAQPMVFPFAARAGSHRNGCGRGAPLSAQAD